MRKGFAPILIVLGLISIIVIVFFGLRYYAKTHSISIDQNTSILTQGQTLPPQTTPTPFVETVNWKTYQNIKGKYSLRYPNGWGTEKCPSGFGNPSDTEVYICSNERFGDVEPIFYYIWVAPALSLPNINETNYRQETINNLTVFRTKDLPSGSGAESVFFRRNESSYVEIVFTPYDENDPFQDQDRFYKNFDKVK